MSEALAERVVEAQVAEQQGPLRLRLTCDLEFDERLLPLVAAAGTLISLLGERLQRRQEHP